MAGVREQPRFPKLVRREARFIPTPTCLRSASSFTARLTCSGCSLGEPGSGEGTGWWIWGQAGARGLLQGPRPPCWLAAWSLRES